jgi:acetate kinase
VSKTATIIAINNGSSNLKFKLFSLTDPPLQLMSGKVMGIGSAKTSLNISYGKGHQISSSETGVDSIEKAGNLVITWLNQQAGNYEIKGIGHRVVQGGLVFSNPEPVNIYFLNELKKIELLASLHLPPAISIMQLFLQAFPSIPQFACFDTRFHRDMPFEARHVALPRSLWKKGIVRYGFHGLSCQYIIEYLQLDDPLIKEKKIIIAHLGSGSSMTAVKNGTSIDTTMGFTPAGGLIMNTRSGDIDPGIIPYLLEEEKMNASALTELFSKQAGMKAISGSDHSIQQLLEDEKTDQHAAQTIKMFCYQARKNIGALATALEGLDILVFTGGIGENEPLIRERICQGLHFLGIDIDKELNDRSAREIGIKNNKVSVRVIRTDEEIIIAREVFGFLRKENTLYGSLIRS